MSLTPRLLTGAFALGLLAACDQPLDLDMRGATGGFTTAPAVQGATAGRPAADSRGIISYPTYQVAVAERGDTIDAVAARIGADPEQLARFNGIDRNVPLRQGEVIALPGRVSEPAPGTAGAIDITTLAGGAIDASPATPRVTTTALEPPRAATTAAPRAVGEPIRHKVSRGETAYTISRLYQVPVRSLAEWNGLGPDFAIREGQHLLIPVANTPAPVQTAAVTAPGEGSATPTPPSASKPLPRETVAPPPHRPWQRL